MQSFGVSGVSEEADGSGLALGEHGCGKRSAKACPRIKVERMAPKVGPSCVRWRMTVDKEKKTVTVDCKIAPRKLLVFSIDA